MGSVHIAGGKKEKNLENKKARMISPGWEKPGLEFI